MKKPLVLSVMVLSLASLAAAADWTADFEPNVAAPAGLPVLTVVGTNASAAASVGVELVRRETDCGVKVSGRVTNRTADRRLVRFSLPGFKHVKVRGKPRLYLPYGLGMRVSDFPKSAADADKKLWKDLGDGTLECDPVWWHRLDFWYPSARRSMSYLALEGEGETVYVACEDPAFGNKLVHVVYDPAARDFSFRVEHMLALAPGESADLPPTAMERLDGDWHAAAKRYRRWSDTAFRPLGHSRAGRDFTGWLLVIVKQQNGEIVWPYADFDQLADEAVRHGVGWVGLFGWTEHGHDNRYPDYAPCPQMGGRAALVEGVKKLHEKGIKVWNYANGQLLDHDATDYWRTTGRRHLVVRADGTFESECWQKYFSHPAHVLDVACLHSEAWFRKMLHEARVAADLGMDGILYDQLASVQSRRCYAADHGHPVGAAVQGGERVRFVRRLDEEMQKVKPGFHVLTEGFCDCELGAISVFHGYAPGVFAAAEWLDTVDPRRGGKGVTYPEMARYTFPEIVISMRTPEPMATRANANYAAMLALRHDIEIRYAPDRRYVQEGRIPEIADYADVVAKPCLADLRAGVPQTVARDYLKSVCDFQKAHGEFLLAGDFADTEGFSVEGDPVVARGFRNAAGGLAVLVWNTSTNAPARFAVSAKGAAVKAAYEPGKSGAVDPASPLAPDALRLVVVRQHACP